MRLLFFAALAALFSLAWTTRAGAEIVHVHVDAPADVQLEGQLGKRWEKLCDAPCDVALPAGLTVRVTGDELVPSAPTVLSPATHVTLTVQPSRPVSRRGPILVLVVGSIAVAPVVVVTGVAMLFFVLEATFGCTHPEPGGNYGSCMTDYLGRVGTLYASPYVWIPALPGLGAIALGVASMPKNTAPPSTLTQTTGILAPRWDVAAPPSSLPAVISVPVWLGSF